MRQAFINDISNQLGTMNLSSEDPEENWTVFQRVVHSSAATTIGHPSRKHRKDMKKFHDALKTIYGPKSSGANPLLSADGSTLLTDKDAILKRWAEHFNSVLNRPSSVNDNAINRLPQIECNVLLDEFPTVTETRKAI